MIVFRVFQVRPPQKIYFLKLGKIGTVARFFITLACVLHTCYSIVTMKTATIHARIEPDTKEKAEKVLRKLGLTPTEAIRIFYRQICLGNGLPFPVEIPNKRTAETLEKSQRGEEVEEFDSLDEMFDTWPS
ncbi:hypothetical protein GKODMF_12955 [Candidatus Electrothrix gigas]